MNTCTYVSVYVYVCVSLYIYDIMTYIESNIINICIMYTIRDYGPQEVDTAITRIVMITVRKYPYRSVCIPAMQ